ncbi:hypothetical protein HYH03_008283 [Edaphochlamys debaryana]|uniref:Uncharacterized protein n=1 Tax=Edaphochlamys debaryana TaxID=47281 RepID=A0A836BY55_9CHLO|nr:hypothetical protein HYH03_008283 [Edaphochlamys debaryana]|eukprot:KAG2493466.1 hypothetical protein HYH03_008283 [Edaphochlamys debaryana]
MRMEDAVLHGCLSIIIMDNTHAVFEGALDLDSFSLGLKEAALNERLPHILKATSPEQIEHMQRWLAGGWHRLAYAHGPLMHSATPSL